MEFEVEFIFCYVGNYTDSVFFNCYGIYSITIIAARHCGERKTKNKQ
jgi:hypothetical protein